MKLTVAIAILFHLSAVDAALRQSADRVRNINDANPWTAFQDQQGSESVIEALQKQVQQLQDQEATILELMEAMEAEYAAASSLVPTVAPTASPSLASVPSASPTPLETASPTNLTAFPTATPTASPTNLTAFPTTTPTASPTNLTAFPTVTPSASPTNQTAFPTETPSASPTNQTAFPTETPSASPTNQTAFPSSSPTLQSFPSASPTISSAPSGTPTSLPTVSVAPSHNPTLGGCGGITAAEREAVILGILDQVADSALIRDVSTPQGKATRWIISEDERVLCPNDPDIIQRWTVAVMYYSTEGNAWTHCFQGDLECGTKAPFINKVALLSPMHECQWAGITCNSKGKVTEVEYEANNLVGTIPTELGLLSQLAIWGMEQGNLTGTIPTEMGGLRNLIFIDLDFNSLTGSLPTELYQLVNLTQLDLNNNQLSGPVSGLGAFTLLEFMQLHENLFTGTIPNAVGSFTRLSTFTLHNTNFVGSVPVGLCTIVDSGLLTDLIADCLGPNPEITCECCTDCRI